MNIHPQTVEALDSERQRKQLVENLVAEHSPGWSEQYKPGTFGCHELLDRTILAAGAVEENVLSHPACVHNPEWYALAEKAVTALNDLYQRVGAEHLVVDSPFDVKRDLG